MGVKKRKRIFALVLTLGVGIYLAGSFEPVGECCFFATRPLNVVEKKSGFTPFQISTLPQLGGGLFKQNTPVYGMSVGGMVHQKEINGLSIAGIHAFTKRKNGLSFSFMDVCEESRGASFFAAGGAERNYGFAAGLVNLAEHNSGVQLGLINQVMPDAVIENNYSTPEKPEGFGVQAGVVNYSEGKGLQFGLWNTNTNAWIKHFPFFNFAF